MDLSYNNINKDSSKRTEALKALKEANKKNKDADNSPNRGGECDTYDVLSTKMRDDLAIIEYENEEIIIKFTPDAITRIKFLKEVRKDKGILCIGVKDGGCSGKSYDISLSTDREAIAVIEHQDQEMVGIRKEHLSAFKNCIIDFKKGLCSGKFKIINLGAEKICKCGSSFG